MFHPITIPFDCVMLFNRIRLKEGVTAEIFAMSCIGQVYHRQFRLGNVVVRFAKNMAARGRQTVKRRSRPRLRIAPMCPATNSALRRPAFMSAQPVVSFPS